MQITNFKLINFLNQDAETIATHVTALRYIKPKQTQRKIFNLKLKEVEEIKQKINSADDLDLIEVVSIVQDITKDDVLDLKIVDFFALIASIKEQLNIIIRAEENGLKPNKIDPKWELVKGSERLSKFGIYNTLESLSSGDATKYAEYIEMDYSQVFTILHMRKTMRDIQDEMAQIKI